MKHTIINAMKGLAMLIVVSLPFTSCYKKFDAGTYAPPFTINGYSSSSAIQSSSLVAYWAFNGNLVDSVSNTSATNSGTTFANGFRGQALNFNAAGKTYVTAPSTALQNLNSFTISLWVNPTFVDANNDGKIDGVLGFVNLARTDDFWGDIDWFIDGGNNTAATIKVHVVGGTSDTWLVLNNVSGVFNTWSNHTLTYDAATSKLTYYINGAKVGDATSSWGGPIHFPSPGPLVFGTVQFQTNPSLGTAGGSQTWASYLTGNLDEVRVYNKALTASEVQALVVLQGKGK